MDIQKLRTPKGLAWLRQQYPEIGRLGEMLPGVAQNQLMFEMQGIRMLNVTTWTTGVREIVSAERAGVKFILSDHPVTLYNHAVPPSDARNKVVAAYARTTFLDRRRTLMQEWATFCMGG